MKSQAKAYLYASLAVLAWSTVATGFKLALRHMESVQLLFYANLTAVVALALILVVLRKGRALLALTRRQCLYSMGLGLINPCLYYLILFEAYARLPGQVVQPINFTWALVLAFLSVPLLKQRLTRRDVAAGLISYSGVFVISTGGAIDGLALESPLGLGLVLISTVIWALYWILGTRNQADPICALFLGFCLSLPCVAVVCGVRSSFVIASPVGLYGAVYTGLVEMAIAFTLWLLALKHTRDAVRISYLIFLAPFLSLQFLHWFAGEVIRPSTYAGLFLIVVGLLVQKGVFLRHSSGA